MIVEKQKNSSWGDGFIDSISKDLKREFPSMKGFSKLNIELMRQWYTFWLSGSVITKQLVSQMKNENGQQVVSQLEDTKSPQVVDEIFQIPWGHNISI